MIAYEYFREPTPHIFLPQLMPPDVYAQLQFPTIRSAPHGRAGRDLYEGEPGYDRVISSPAWRTLHAMFASEACVRWLLQVFEEDLARLRCRVDVVRAVYRPFVEPREMVQEIRGAISGRDVNELFTRFDLQAADAKYARYVHLDRIRRVVGGLLFCSDQQQEGLVGGQFGLYRDRWPGDDRRCLWPTLVKRFGVSHNTGVVFLNGNTAFHGPLPIHAVRGLRKWIYFSISSHQPVWSIGRPSALRKWALQLKRLVLADRP